MARFWRSYWCSLVAIIKDRNVLLLVLIGPIVYSIYYPFPYSPEVVRNIPVAIADLDHTSLSRELIRLANASPDIKVTRVVNDTREIKQALWDGDIQGGLIIPRGFRKDFLRGTVAKTIVLGNGAYFMFNRGQLLGFVGASQALSDKLKLKHEMKTSVSSQQAMERSRPVRLELRAASNKTGGYSTYVVPAVAAIVLQQTLLLGICMLLGTWRQSGAPFNMQYCRNRLGLVFAAATICLLNTLYYIGIVYWREDYPHLGQLPDLLTVVLIFSLTAAAWSVVIGSWFRYREQAVIHLIPTSIPIIFLAGFAWPVESIPEPLVALSFLVPSTASVQALLNVDQMGASLVQVLPEVISLLLLLIAMLIMIMLRKNWPLPFKK
ncbi:ABC transporter permease [Paraglaciecola sp. L3A3]|uniref:ABC transporter permease n=1 Tax=Paraglaciecola sp. L3A3 TaxID=2686358 RepID=UPI00131A8C1D|nr:ABC transporter permease [Paraglaciecola sp. L3A3]